LFISSEKEQLQSGFIIVYLFVGNFFRRVWMITSFDGEFKKFPFHHNTI